MKDSFRLWPRVYERQPIDGGGAIFDGIVNSAELGTSAVTTAKIKDAAVTSDKVGSDAITEGKIKDFSISASKIQTNALGSIAIGTGAITSAELASSAVTQGKINDGAVTSAKLGSNSVLTAKINDSAVTSNKIASSAVTDAKVSAIDAGKITSGQVALARGGTGQNLSGKTVAVLEDAQTFTNIQNFNSIIRTQEDFGNAISAGVLTVTKTYTRADTENSDPTDDLNTISGLGSDGGRLILMSTSSNRDPTVKDNADNIFCAGDFTFTIFGDTMEFISQGSNVYEISRSDNG